MSTSLRKKVLSIVLAAAMIIPTGSAVFADTQPAETTAPTAVSVTLSGTDMATVKLEGITEDVAKDVTSVALDGTELAKGTDYTVAAGSIKIAAAKLDKVPKRKNTFNLVIKSTGHDDVNAELTVINYGAETLYVRHLDKDGNVLAEKSFTMDEIKSMSNVKDQTYQSFCSMRGVTSFKATGVKLSTILEKAGMTDAFKEGTEILVRTNDGNKASTKNDDDSDNSSYYQRGKYSYKFLTEPRYTFTDIYSNKNADLSSKVVSDIQAYLNAVNNDKEHVDTFEATVKKDLGSAKREHVDPVIAYEFAEKQLRKDPTDLTNDSYGRTQKDRAFRLLFGLAMDDNDPSSARKKEQTTFSITYAIYGIDIIDTEKDVRDTTELEKTIKQAKALKAEDYTSDSWDALQESLENAEALVADLAHHTTTMEDVTKADEALKAAMKALVPVNPQPQPEQKIAVKSIKLAKTSFKYNGKAVKLTVKAVDENGKAVASSNYTVSSVNAKKVGKYSVTVTMNGNYTGSKKLSFTIVPAGTSLKSVKAGKKSATVTWKKNTKETSGYQIRFVKGKKTAKTVTVSSNKKTKAVVKKLSSKKKYSVSIRTYKKVGKTTFYSSWSKAKTVKVK